MFDDVRPHSQGRTFISPVGFGGGKAPSQPSPRGRSLFSLCFRRFDGTPSPWEGTEKLKPTIKLKVDDGEIAVLPFIICLF